VYWENYVEGTRQNDSVTSGERVTNLICWHRIGGSDCLVKTQDSAKSKDDV